MVIVDNGGWHTGIERSKWDIDELQYKVVQLEEELDKLRGDRNKAINLLRSCYKDGEIRNAEDFGREYREIQVFLQKLEDKNG